MMKGKMAMTSLRNAKTGYSQARRTINVASLQAYHACTKSSDNLRQAHSALYQLHAAHFADGGFAEMHGE